MVCRSTPGNSALTTYARAVSGLHDVQVLSLFHEIRSEIPRTDRSMADPDEVEASLEATYAAVGDRDGQAVFSDARRASIRERLRSASERPVDRRTFHAWNNITERSIRARAAMDSHFQTVARMNPSITPEQAQAFFNSAMERDYRVSGQDPEVPEHVPFSTANLPADDRTRHALGMLYAGAHPDMRPDALGETQQRMLTTSRRLGSRSDSTNTTGLIHREDTSEAAIQRTLRHINTQSGSDAQIAAARQAIADVSGADPQTVAAWMSAGPTIYRGNGRYGLSNGNEAPSMMEAWVRQGVLDREHLARGHHTRCGSCGQWRGQAAHTCPEPQGPGHTAPAPQRVRAAAPSAPTTSPHPSDSSAVPSPATPGGATAETRTPTRTRTPLRSYQHVTDQGSTITTRMTNLTQARLTASGAVGTGATYDSPLDATISDSNGTTYQVTGTVRLTDHGGRVGANRDRYRAETVEYADDEGETRRSLRCTCPVYQRNYDCEHLRQATSHAQSLLNRRQAPVTPPQAAVESVEAALREEFNDSQAAQQQARADFRAGASGRSYRDDMDAFQEAWDEAKTHFATGATEIPYMTENATGGLGARDGGRSFGIEIEVDFPDDMSNTAKEAVAREMYEAGLSRTPHVQGWHYIGRAGGGYTTDANAWSVEYDSTVDCEIVSPIMYDEPQTWENLAKVCEIVQRHGGQVTPRTGLHINVGAADFDHTVENHNRLLRLGMGYEDVLVRTAHNPQSGPRHRGRDYCRPMSVPSEGYATISEAQRSIDPYANNGRSHRAMINLDHVPAEGQRVTSATRVEVRVFDGAIDPGRIQVNTKIGLGLVNAAARGVETPDIGERAGTHRRANMQSNGRMRRMSGEDWRQDTASYRSFADTIFTREEDKRQMTYAYQSSKWQMEAAQHSHAYRGSFNASA